MVEIEFEETAESFIRDDYRLRIRSIEILYYLLILFNLLQFSYFVAVYLSRVLGPRFILCFPSFGQKKIKKII